MTTPTMKAAIRTVYGPPQAITLAELPIPEPKGREVLIRVHATTVNRTDCANLTGRPFVMHLVLGIRKPRTARIGTDFAGEVTAVGASVTKYRVGDRVCGFRDTGLGAHAEWLAMDENGPLISIPGDISYAHATASLEGAHYAYSFLRRARVNPGRRVLINGATGAIGSALLQFTVEQGAHVTATAKAEHAALIRELGAREVIDYETEDFTHTTERYDFVFDAVGKSTFGRCRPLLRDKGVYISSEAGPYLQHIFYALTTPLRPGKLVRFPVPYGYTESFPFIRRHLEAGTFRPLLDDRSFTLSEIADAYRYVMTGQKRGNVILRIVD